MMDPNSQHLPRPRRDLKFFPVTEKGETCYIIEDPVRNKYFRLGKEEYLFLTHLERFSTLDELLSFIGGQLGISLDQDQAQTLLSWLHSRQLLQQKAPGLLAASLEQDRRNRSLKRFSRLNLITVKLPLLNPDPLLRYCRPLLWMTGSVFFLLWGLAALAAGWFLYLNWPQFTAHAQGFFSMDNLLRIWLIYFGLKLIHEFFHALVCYRYGGRVYEAGLLFILFIPLTYVNATSSWTFPSRWQRVHVAIAGIFIELGIAFLSIVVWAQSPTTVTGFIAYQTALVAGVSSLLFNANPLMRFDGYYVLSDLIGVPNLYQLGMGTVHSRLRHFFLGVGPLASTPWYIGLYGIAAYLWRITVLFSLAYLASKLAGGLGIFITVGALAVWTGFPLLALFRRWPSYTEQNPRCLLQLLTRSGICAGIVLLLVFFAGWEQRLQAHGIIEYRQQYSLKSASPGFITTVQVTDGQRVQRGDVLLTLENRELRTTYRQLILQLRQMELKIRLAHSSGNIAERQNLREQYQAMEQQRKKTEEDLNALTIRAPGEGTVICRSLADELGTYIPKGEELLWVVTAQQKQLTAFAPQESVDTFRSLIGNPVRVDMRSAGIGVFTGSLLQVVPSGTTELVHPALSAINGGPLDVRQQSGEQEVAQEQLSSAFQLFAPHFSMAVEIPEHVRERVWAGQPATITVRGKRVRLLDILRGRLHAWQTGKDEGA